VRRIVFSKQRFFVPSKYFLFFYRPQAQKDLENTDLEELIKKSFQIRNGLVAVY
jgi:hypothetical protein